MAQKIETERYSSASEAIQAGFRLLEEYEIKFDALRHALIEGEKSGTADYSPHAVIDELEREG
jgi:antitoxin ParD1/3/4